jgi:hypothetical protein
MARRRLPVLGGWPVARQLAQRDELGLAGLARGSILVTRVKD